MKRFFCFLTIIILVCGFCLAEESQGSVDFEFRNGIRFGDSMAEVQEKEKEKLYPRNDHTLVCPKLTMSGIKGSVLYYYFTEDALTSIEIMYCSKSYTEASFETELAESYTTIEEGLERKYGTGVHGFSDIAEVPEGLILYFGEEKLLSMSQRIPSYDGYDVVIDHVSVREPETETLSSYVHAVSYSVIEHGLTKNDIVDNDL